VLAVVSTMVVLAALPAESATEYRLTTSFGIHCSATSSAGWIDGPIYDTAWAKTSDLRGSTNDYTYCEGTKVAVGYYNQGGPVWSSYRYSTRPFASISRTSVWRCYGGFHGPSTHDSHYPTTDYLGRC